MGIWSQIDCEWHWVFILYFWSGSLGYLFNFIFSDAFLSYNRIAMVMKMWGCFIAIVACVRFVLIDQVVSQELADHSVQWVYPTTTRHLALAAVWQLGGFFVTYFVRGVLMYFKGEHSFVSVQLPISVSLLPVNKNDANPVLHHHPPIMLVQCDLASFVRSECPRTKLIQCDPIPTTHRYPFNPLIRNALLSRIAHRRAYFLIVLVLVRHHRVCTG